MPDRLTLIAGLLVEAALCLECIAQKAAVTPAGAEAWVAIIARTVNLNRTLSLCEGCDRTRNVASMTRPI